MRPQNQLKSKSRSSTSKKLRQLQTAETMVAPSVQPNEIETYEAQIQDLVRAFSDKPLFDFLLTDVDRSRLSQISQILADKGDFSGMQRVAEQVEILDSLVIKRLDEKHNQQKLIFDKSNTNNESTLQDILKEATETDPLSLTEPALRAKLGYFELNFFSYQHADFQTLLMLSERMDFLRRALRAKEFPSLAELAEPTDLELPADSAAITVPPNAIELAIRNADIATDVFESASESEHVHSHSEVLQPHPVDEGKTSVEIPAPNNDVVVLDENGLSAISAENDQHMLRSPPAIPGDIISVGVSDPDSDEVESDEVVNQLPSAEIYVKTNPEVLHTQPEVAGDSSLVEAASANDHLVEVSEVLTEPPLTEVSKETIADTTLVEESASNNDVVGSDDDVGGLLPSAEIFAKSDVEALHTHAALSEEVEASSPNNDMVVLIGDESELPPAEIFAEREPLHAQTAMADTQWVEELSGDNDMAVIDEAANEQLSTAALSKKSLSDAVVHETSAQAFEIFTPPTISKESTTHDESPLVGIGSIQEELPVASEDNSDVNLNENSSIENEKALIVRMRINVWRHRISKIKRYREFITERNNREQALFFTHWILLAELRKQETDSLIDMFRKSCVLRAWKAHTCDISKSIERMQESASRRLVKDVVQVWSNLLRDRQTQDALARQLLRKRRIRGVLHSFRQNAIQSASTKYSVGVFTNARALKHKKTALHAWVVLVRVGHAYDRKRTAQVLFAWRAHRVAMSREKVLTRLVILMRNAHALTDAFHCWNMQILSNTHSLLPSPTRKNSIQYYSISDQDDVKGEISIIESSPSIRTLRDSTESLIAETQIFLSCRKLGKPLALPTIPNTHPDHIKWISAKHWSRSEPVILESKVCDDFFNHFEEKWKREEKLWGFF